MRNRKTPTSHLAEGNVSIQISVQFGFNEKGLPDWTSSTCCISSPVSKKLTQTFIQDALKKFPKDIKPSDGEITVQIPFSYESIGNGKLGWKVGAAVIGSPADRETTIQLVRKILNI